MTVWPVVFLNNANSMAIHSNISEIHTPEICEVSCEGLQEIVGVRFTHS